MCAYSRLVRPGPGLSVAPPNALAAAHAAPHAPAPSGYSLGKNKFHRPSSLARRFSFSITGGVCARTRVRSAAHACARTCGCAVAWVRVRVPSSGPCRPCAPPDTLARPACIHSAPAPARQRRRTVGARPSSTHVDKGAQAVQQALRPRRQLQQRRHLWNALRRRHDPWCV
jgi:hypothetical protein